MGREELLVEDHFRQLLRVSGKLECRYLIYDRIMSLFEIKPWESALMCTQNFGNIYTSSYLC